MENNASKVFNLYAVKSKLIWKPEYSFYRSLEFSVFFLTWFTLISIPIKQLFFSEVVNDTVKKVVAQLLNPTKSLLFTCLLYMSP